MKAKDALLHVQNLIQRNLFIADLYSIIGCVYFEMNQHKLSVMYHQKAIDMAFKYDLRETQLKAYDAAHVWYIYSILDWHCLPKRLNAKAIF